MKTTLKVLPALLVPVLLSACASTPTPAEICSAEWIAPRADRAVERIEKRAKKSIKTLSSVSKSWAAGKTPGPLQMFALSRAMKSLETELTQGKGITDLKTVAKTCNDPEIVSDAMRGLLERQGVSERLITQVEANPIYQRLISSVTAPEPVTR